MFGIGLQELLVILVVALFVVGPKKLPGVARSLGQGVSELRKAAGDVMDSVSQHEEFKEFKKMKDDLEETVKTVRDPMSALTESVKEDFARTIDLEPETKTIETSGASGLNDSEIKAEAQTTGLQDSVEPEPVASGVPAIVETEKKSDA